MAETKEKRPRGAPKGNQNAKGHGAPRGNHNAQTHGAYSQPDIGSFSEEELEDIHRASGVDAILEELTARRIDLSKKIRALEDSQQEKYDTSGVDNIKDGTRAGSVIYWESKFSRLEKLETQYHRVLGNVIKVSESLQKAALERARLQLERDRLQLAREKATGIFEDVVFHEKI